MARAKPAKKKKTKPRIEIDYQKVEDLAARGLTQDAISQVLGISTKTIERRKQEPASEMSAAIARGKARGEQIIASKLFEAAARGHVEACKFYLARRCGWKETLAQEHSGEVTGGIINLIVTPAEAAL